MDKTTLKPEMIGTLPHGDTEIVWPELDVTGFPVNRRNVSKYNIPGGKFVAVPAGVQFAYEPKVDEAKPSAQNTAPGASANPSSTVTSSASTTAVTPKRTAGTQE